MFYGPVWTGFNLSAKRIKKMKSRTFLAIGFVIAVTVTTLAFTGVNPVGNAFTYQGLLKQSGKPASGQFDLLFSLFASPTGGTAIDSVFHPDVDVTDGLFTVELDFSDGPEIFDGNARWVEVIVDGQPLTPRQRIGAVPYAAFAL